MHIDDVVDRDVVSVVEGDLQVHNIFGILNDAPSEVEKLSVVCGQDFNRDIQHGLVNVGEVERHNKRLVELKVQNTCR